MQNIHSQIIVNQMGENKNIVTTHLNSFSSNMCLRRRDTYKFQTKYQNKTYDIWNICKKNDKFTQPVQSF